MYQVVPGPATIAAPTVMEMLAVDVAAGLALSLTCTVKLDVPVADGVPEMAPVELFSVNPVGRLPEANDQV